MFDETNPTSLINLVPDRMVPLLKATAQRFPKLIHSSERVVRYKTSPDDRDERLRLSFWEEYNAATGQCRRMTMSNILRNVIFSEVWNNYYEKRLDKIAFMLCIPRNYSLTLRQILDKGLDRLTEIMQLPILKADGEPNIQAISQVLKAFQLVDTRVKGAVIQRVQIQQQSLNFNTDVSADFAKQQAQQLAALSLEDLELLERKIKKVERLEGKMIDALPPETQELIGELKGELPAAERYPIKTYPEEQTVDV